MRLAPWLCAGLVMAGLGGVPGPARGDGGDGPAEPPPANFSGPQYVDSRGCAYMRARLDGQVAWVPRLARDRTPVCGLAPTVFAATPPKTVPAAATTPPGGARSTRARSATPVARRAEAYRAAGADGLGAVPIRIPRGYRAVWTDDRLNPYRGPRTAEGDAQMALIWTNTVPQRLVPTAASSRPAQAPRYLRVGIYDAPEAARPTVHRVRALGLPVSRATGRRGAAPVEVIYAGPFADASAAARAEARLKRAGFRNLVPRK